MKMACPVRIIRPENLFLIIGFVFGVLNLILTPPFQVADEDRHFYRAFQVAEGGIIATVHEGRVGGWLPESVFRCGSSTSYMRWKTSQKITRHDIISQFKEPLNSKDRVFGGFRSSVYSPIAYLPSALIIRIGIWLELSPILLMYLGRIANLACWLGLVYAAVRIIPFYKWVFFLLALTPMSLYQAASLSADSMTNALAFFTTAYFIYWAYTPEKRPGPYNILLFFLLTVLLSFSKIIFFLFCFLFLLIPRDKFSSKKTYYLFFASLVAANILSCFTWYKIVNTMPLSWAPDVFPDEQIKFIVTQPLTYFSISLKNLMGQIEYGAKTFVGRFGWMDTPLPKWHFWGWAFVLLSTILTDGCKKSSVRCVDKMLCFSVFAMTYMLIITLLYIYWNPVGAEKMVLVQGRYFIPIAPLFFLCLYNRRFSCHSFIKPIVLSFITMLSLTFALCVIYSRFYVPGV